MKERPLCYCVKLTPTTKKNHQEIKKNWKTGKKFISQSDQYKQYAKDAVRFLKPIPSSPISYPVEIKAIFYMPTHRRVDLTNLLEAIDDILVDAGIIADDNSNIVVSHDGSRVLYDKEHPRTEITIYKLTEGDSNEEKIPKV